MNYPNVQQPPQLKVSRAKLTQLAEIMQRNLVSEEAPVASFVDFDLVRATVNDLKSSFPDCFFHTFAVKANSMVPVLSELRELGMGAEVASPGEMEQALQAGFQPENMVFDEPAKTTSAIRYALKKGINLNIDNFQEFDIVKTEVEKRSISGRVGFRINPQLGSGQIVAMSTATATSKFGVPLADPGVRAHLVALYQANPWLNSLHTHVGSQGCSMELMAQGANTLVDLAEEINHLVGRQQVTTLDIGGGLTVNFDSEEVTPSFSEYAAYLKDRAPVLFTGKYKILTEFGRSIMAKNGYIVSRVEYAKVSGGRHIAITHSGAQIAARTVFMPDAWPIRVTAHNPDGSAKTGPDVLQDIAGPCCFAGDKIRSNYALPLLDRDDIVVLHDTGAYYFSNPFFYNSLPACSVYGLTRSEKGLEVRTLRSQQSVQQVMSVIG